ncbi:hypothetical protein MC885_003713, partial [Smutsia gigantea]
MLCDLPSSPWTMLCDLSFRPQYRLHSYGLCISKPEMISSLEQKKEPWTVKRKPTRGQSPDLKAVPETKELPPEALCEEKLGQALMMARLPSHSLECPILGGSDALFERQPGLVTLTNMALGFSRLLGPGGKSLCESAVWESPRDLASA